MSDAVFEATLALAPEKARQAIMTTAAAKAMFVQMYGREPSDQGLNDRFIAEAVAVGCTESDIEWLIEAEILDPELLEMWKEATHEHA